MPARIELDSTPKEVTFDFPGADKFFQPWNSWKESLSEQNGLRIGLDYQPVAQWSNNTIGEDNAAGGIFRGFFSWDTWNRGNPSRIGSIDMRIEHRHRLGTELPPESLAPNFGWLGTTAPDWSDQKWGLPIFMLRQRLDVGEAPIELRVGRMSPFSQFDITPYSDNLTVFQNNSIILNPTIGYPSAGSFGVAGYVGIPRSKFYALGMVMDANGQYDNLGFDTLEEGEFFTALEFGWTDQDLFGLAYLFNNLHVSAWHSDKTGKGVTLTGSYLVPEKRLGVFGRLGWASEDASTIYENYAAAGVTRDIYKDSMIGIGVSWGQAHGSNVDQVATEIFYRWQMAQHTALTPGIQFLSDPALNEDDDLVTVFSFRLRIAI